MSEEQSRQASVAGRSVQQWLRERNEEKMIDTFRNLVEQFGIDALHSYTDRGTKHKHAIVHELARKDKPQVLKHLVEEHDFNINLQRGSDQCTPLHIAFYFKNTALADTLIKPGADGSLRNRYGEPACLENYGEEAYCQLTTRLQGARDVEEILQVVGSDLEKFGHIEVVTAYYLLGNKTADYDAVHCTYTSTRQNRLFDDPRFHSLVDACKSLVSDGVIGTLWATLANGLVKLPHPDINRAFMEAAQSKENKLFQGCEAGKLALLAWAFAKLFGNDPAYSLLFKLLADQVSGDVGSLQIREVSELPWAYGKSGNLHEPLLEAAAAFVKEHAGDFNPQGLSNVAWALAKLGRKGCPAFGAISRAVIVSVNDFSDQNVANVAWAFAKSNVADEELYRACF